MGAQRKPGKADILSEIYSSDEVAKMIRSLKPQHLQQDIKQHCFLELFEKDEAFIMDLHERGKLKNYIVKVLYNTARFTRTSFTKQLGRETPTESFEETIDEEYEEVTVNLENLHWYNREVLKLYAEEGTYQKVSKLTQIPMTSIYQTVLATRKQLLKEYYESIKH
jgi:DNA-directed RNA polymerase specialized sigma24 family protein